MFCALSCVKCLGFAWIYLAWLCLALLSLCLALIGVAIGFAVLCLALRGLAWRCVAWRCLAWLCLALLLRCVAWLCVALLGAFRSLTNKGIDGTTSLNKSPLHKEHKGNISGHNLTGQVRNCRFHLVLMLCECRNMCIDHSCSTSPPGGNQVDGNNVVKRALRVPLAVTKLTVTML